MASSKPKKPSKPNKPSKPKTPPVSSLPVVNVHAAGVDVGHESHFVCVGGDRENDVRWFGSFTVDLNALADEYLRLSYHGLRAKDKSFNANMRTDFDPAVGTVAAVPQDLGRVLLNLINNAFYAVAQKKKNLAAASSGAEAYEPTVAVSTQKRSNAVEIRIRDNGTGIPDSLRAKIFQPFFTTKPTGQGTGLGLSLAYDIVTKGHGGTMDVETQEGEGTVFIIQLPLQQEQP